MDAFHWLQETLMQETLNLNPDLQNRLIKTLVAIVFLWVLNRIVIRFINKWHEDPRVLYRWRKTSGHISVAVGLFVVGQIWFEGVKSISTFLGLLSAGLAIALKDPIVNLAGWAFILWRRPFEVGDRIQIGNQSGDVIDQRIFQFTLMEIGNWVDADQSTGRIIHMPNGKIFTEAQANYTQGFQYIWNEIPVMVTFESDWKKTKSLLEHIASKHVEHLSKSAEQRLKQAARKFMIFYNALTPAVYTTVKDSGVVLTIRYLCDPRQRRGTEQAMWEDILDTFSQHRDIDLAYPTQRFYYNPTEGSPASPPPSQKPPNSAPMPPNQ